MNAKQLVEKLNNLLAESGSDDELPDEAEGIVAEALGPQSDEDLAKSNFVPVDVVQKYRTAAKNRYEKDGILEIDDNAPVSVGEDSGAYVQAWVWVEDKDAKIDRDKS